MRILACHALIDFELLQWLSHLLSLLRLHSYTIWVIPCFFNLLQQSLMIFIVVFHLFLLFPSFCCLFLLFQTTFLFQLHPQAFFLLSFQLVFKVLFRDHVVPILTLILIHFFLFFGRFDGLFRLLFLFGLLELLFNIVALLTSWLRFIPLKFDVNFVMCSFLLFHFYHLIGGLIVQ